MLRQGGAAVFVGISRIAGALSAIQQGAGAVGWGAAGLTGGWMAGQGGANGGKPENSLPHPRPESASHPTDTSRESKLENGKSGGVGGRAGAARVAVFGDAAQGSAVSCVVTVIIITGAKPIRDVFLLRPTPCIHLAKREKASRRKRVALQRRDTMSAHREASCRSVARPGSCVCKSCRYVLRSGFW